MLWQKSWKTLNILHWPFDFDHVWTKGYDIYIRGDNFLRPVVVWRPQDSRNTQLRDHGFEILWQLFEIMTFFWDWGTGWWVVGWNVPKRGGPIIIALLGEARIETQGMILTSVILIFSVLDCEGPRGPGRWILRYHWKEFGDEIFGGWFFDGFGGFLGSPGVVTVSYTHLTLPTICSV